MIINYDGLKLKIEYDADGKYYYGEVLDIKDYICFDFQTEQEFYEMLKEVKQDLE